MTIQEVAQRADADRYVQLFQLDATALGGEIYRFTPNVTESQQAVMWQGHPYTPIPIEAEGFEMNGQGALPTPVLRMSNLQPVVTSLILTYKNLVGCIVTRCRTYRRFLDDGEEPNPDAHLPLDIYEITRKKLHVRRVVEWELSAAIDQAGRMLPQRPATRDFCPWRYRRWDAEAGAFDYTRAFCPYAGDAYFDAQGRPVEQAAQDRCGKHLADCEARFGRGTPLPFGGFPSLAKTRIRG